MYVVIVVFAAAVIYSAVNDSRYWALFFTAAGYMVLVELYKIDEIENPQNYRKRKK
jgi:hypothetical protein